MPILYDDRIRFLRELGDPMNLKLLCLIFVAGALTNSELAQLAEISDKPLAAKLRLLQNMGYIVSSDDRWRIAPARQMLLGEVLPFGAVGISDQDGISDSVPQLSTDVSTADGQLSTEQAGESQIFAAQDGNSELPIDSSSRVLDPVNSGNLLPTSYSGRVGISDQRYRENTVMLRALGVNGDRIDSIASLAHVSPQFIAAKHAEFQEYQAQAAKLNKPATFGLFLYWLEQPTSRIDKRFQPPPLDLASLVMWAKDSDERKRQSLAIGWLGTQPGGES